MWMDILSGTDGMLNALACGPLFGLVRRVRTKNTAAQRALKP